MQSPHWHWNLTVSIKQEKKKGVHTKGETSERCWCISAWSLPPIKWPSQTEKPLKRISDIYVQKMTDYLSLGYDWKKIEWSLPESKMQTTDWENCFECQCKQNRQSIIPNQSAQIKYCFIPNIGITGFQQLRPFINCSWK